MKTHSLTSIALYLCFGLVLSASGHDIADITYWLLLALFMATDLHSSSTAYRQGLEHGGDAVKKIWGLK